MAEAAIHGPGIPESQAMWDVTQAEPRAHSTPHSHIRDSNLLPRRD